MEADNRITLPDTGLRQRRDDSILSVHDKLLDAKIPYEPHDYDRKSLGTWLEFCMRFLHLIYTALILYVILVYLFQDKIEPVLRIISFSIAIPLVIDNLRIGLSNLPLYLLKVLSKISFFSHEVITPFGLLYIPGVGSVTFDVVGNESLQIVFVAISMILSYQGLYRFLAFTNWTISKVNEVDVYRPSNASHSALIPIFVTVGGLIFVSGWAVFVKEDDSQWILFVSQLFVFLGNGLLGPNKQLQALFGNAFEVLWLWSIIKSLPSKW